MFLGLAFRHLLFVFILLGIYSWLSNQLPAFGYNHYGPKGTDFMVKSEKQIAKGVTPK